MNTEVIALTALIIGILAFLFGTAALSLALATKFSTHQIVWKEAPIHSDDPFKDEDESENKPFEPFENPNKRLKAVPKDVLQDTDFADLDDPTVSSNF